MNRQQAAKPIEQSCEAFLRDLHQRLEQMGDPEVQLTIRRLNDYTSSNIGWYKYRLRDFVIGVIHDHIRAKREHLMPGSTGQHLQEK